LLNLRRRMSRIRVFDPACGSGNFLVIAYKEMRAIEAEIDKRRGEAHRRSDIPLTNFRGIELRDFPAEIARLALVIAEYQCDVLYRDEKLALAEFLPLNAENWITCGNALRLGWLSVCPPTGTGVTHHADDLFHTPLDQAQIDFENQGGETYICGNPPYQGSVNQSSAQKEDMAAIFSKYIKTYKDLDYVAAWLVKAAEFQTVAGGATAFVTTNSLTQGEQVAMLWPIIFSHGRKILFAHRDFRWKNNATENAGVTCVVVGIGNSSNLRYIYDGDERRQVPNIGPYLTASEDIVVQKRTMPLSAILNMQSGNKPTDDGNFILTDDDRQDIVSRNPESSRMIRRYLGSKEIIQGGARWCLWIEDHDLPLATSTPEIWQRIKNVGEFRASSRGKQANDNASTPHRFVFAPHRDCPALAVSNVSSENREYLPCGYFDGNTVISNLASVIYDAPIWNLSIIASRLHLVWAATVCGKLETRYRYSNTLGWNTFPVPVLTEKNKADLTRCAEDILLAREAHFPATIADLYDPEKMPADLREAHERNDEVVERIYIGRRFRNDTERLEKLFELYTAMSSEKKGLRNRTGLKTAR
jgi:hypothetical protein